MIGITNSIKRIILSLKNRLSFNVTQVIVTAAMMIAKEQKRPSSLTIEILNPLVKEIEYVVRDGNLIRDNQICFFLYIRSNRYSCGRNRKIVEGNYL